MKKSIGFSLIELLTVLCIVGILAIFAIPLYTQYVVKENRLEARSMLARLASAMEQFHVGNYSYRQATLESLRFAENIANNTYKLSIQYATDNDYLLIAHPTGTQAQRDLACGVLMLQANGKKRISGNAKLEECWG